MPATNELLQEGRYRINQASPGRVNVFEAYDTVRNTNVVVREIPVKLNKVTTVSQQESLRLAFASQAKALSEIDHQSLLHVHDFFSEIDRQYLVMEAVDGVDLGSLLARNNKPFSVSEVTAWADELLDALTYLHTHKPSIVHRNVRPQNVNLDPSGKIKLLDVGLDGGSDAGAGDDTSDLRYLPIEQIWPGLDPASQKAITNSYDDRSERILKEPLDARSDIYSLGATLYFLVTGLEPVDPLERSIDILEGKLDPLREPSKVDSQIPSEISDVLMKALEIKRENRYDSAKIMRQVLKDAIERVQEREEDTLEQKEAAEIVRIAAQQKNDLEAALAEEQKQAEAEQQRQLREAEAQRAQAEQLAEAERLHREKQLQEEAAAKAKAETERLLREKEEEDAARAKAEAERLAREQEEKDAARAKAEAKAEVEADPGPAAVIGNVLEIPVGAEVSAYRESVDEAELAAVLEELEVAEQAASGTVDEKTSEPAVLVADEVYPDDRIQVFEDPLDMTTPHAVAVNASEAAVDDDEDIFSTPEKSGFSLSMPAIAGAIGLVVVLAIGAWFAMSGSTQVETPAPAPPVQAAQPPQDSPAPEPITSTESQPETVSSTEQPPVDQVAVAAKTAPAPPKAKKAEPAKAGTEKKKAVTVDDLINDN